MSWAVLDKELSRYVPLLQCGEHYVVAGECGTEPRCFRQSVLAPMRDTTLFASASEGRSTANSRRRSAEKAVTLTQV